MNVELPETLVILESVVYKSNGFAIAAGGDTANPPLLLERIQKKSKQPRAKLRALAVESDLSLTSTPNNSYGTLAKTIINHKLIIFTPLLRLFDMACYATGVLITRIEEDSRDVGVQKITSKATILYKKW